MSIIISILVILLGMLLAVQVVASLHGPLDYRYNIKTNLPEVILRILIWGGMCVVLAAVLGDRYRSSFLWGLVVYPVFYIFSYPGTKLLFKRNLKLLKKE